MVSLGLPLCDSLHKPLPDTHSTHKLLLFLCLFLGGSGSLGQLLDGIGILPGLLLCFFCPSFGCLYPGISVNLCPKLLAVFLQVVPGVLDSGGDGGSFPQPFIVGTGQLHLFRLYHLAC